MKLKVYTCWNNHKCKYGTVVPNNKEVILNFVKWTHCFIMVTENNQGQIETLGFI